MSEASPFTTKNSMSSKDLTSPKKLREMMELDYNEIHHSCRIPGTEQAESMEDRRFNEILTEGLHKNAEGNWEAEAKYTLASSRPNPESHRLNQFQYFALSSQPPSSAQE